MILKKKLSVQSESIQYHQTAGEQQYAEQKIVASACCLSKRFQLIRLKLGDYRLQSITKSMDKCQE